ncbi:MucBP domain-containing protein [Lactococcus garvieae]|uniref:MucBP domain-containing protein n=1 Tax=Lactococcus garvieae TaxID=1363 RepID=UPI00398E3BE2
MISSNLLQTAPLASTIFLDEENNTSYSHNLELPQNTEKSIVHIEQTQKSNSQIDSNDQEKSSMYSQDIDSSSSNQSSKKKIPEENSKISENISTSEKLNSKISSSEEALPSATVTTNFNTVKNKSNIAKIDILLNTEVNKTSLKIGDQITLKIDHLGIQYSTLKLLNGSDFFTISNDESSDSITLTAIKDVAYTGNIVLSITASPTKNDENTGTEKQYPLLITYTRNTQTIDVVGDNMLLRVQNNLAGKYDSFGPHLQGSTSTIFDKTLPFHNNYLGYDNYKYMFSYDQKGMLIRATLDNFVHDFVASDLKWGITLKSDIYHSESTFDPSTLRVYYGNQDMTNNINIDIKADNTGFVISLPDYTGYDKNQWSASFIANTDSNTSHVDGSSYVTGIDKSNGEAIETIKNDDLKITLNSGDVMFRYYQTANGNFMPYIEIGDITTYNTQNFTLKKLVDSAKAFDQNDGDISSSILIKDDGDFDSAVAGDYEITLSARNSSGNTAEKAVKIHVIEDKSSVQLKESSIIKGTLWNPRDNFVSAVDKDGNNIPFDALTHDNNVNSNKIGNYPVVFYQTNAGGKNVEFRTIVHVKENLQSISASDVEAFVNDPIPDDSAFKASATNTTGQAIKVNIDKDKVDMSKPGDYDVLVTSEDGQKKTVQVHVKNNAAAPITAHYQDVDGNKIADDEVKFGNIGEDYTTEQKDIDGYTFKEVKGDTSGKFTDKAQSVTYVYTKDPAAGADVTVHYQDVDGNKIADDDVKFGNIGEDYTTEQKDIDGYTFKEVKGDTSGKFTDKAQSVTYVYTKDPVAGADVTAHYQDVDGNKIADDVVKSGNIGEDYTTEQTDIDGYNFKEIQGNASGTFSDQPQEVVYVYVKDTLIDTGTSVNTGTPNNTENPSNHEQNSSDTLLPSTGESKGLLFSIFGALLLILASLSIFLKKKSK